MAAQAAKLKKGAFFVTLTKRLPSKHFALCESELYQMSWGGATVFIQQKTTDRDDSLAAPAGPDSRRCSARYVGHVFYPPFFSVFFCESFLNIANANRQRARADGESAHPPAGERGRGEIRRGQRPTTLRQTSPCPRRFRPSLRRESAARPTRNATDHIDCAKLPPNREQPESSHKVSTPHSEGLCAPRRERAAHAGVLGRYKIRRSDSKTRLRLGGSAFCVCDTRLHLVTHCQRWHWQRDPPPRAEPSGGAHGGWAGGSKHFRVSFLKTI